MTDIIAISFLFPNAISGIINAIIFFLLFLTIIVSWHTNRRYKVMEKDALKAVRNRVEEKLENRSQRQNKNEESPKKKKKNENNGKPAKPEHEILMEKEELCEYADRRSIIYKRINTIEEMRNRQVKINVDFLQQAALTSEASKTGVSLPKFSTNLAMILGLFGTFVGLALMVSKISMLMPGTGAADFSISTLKSSMADMETVFQGIKTAFSTSIAGICTTIVCLILSYKIRRSQTIFFHELETFTVEKLIPVTVPSVESEHIMEKVSLQLNDSFNSIDHIISQNNETLTNLNTIETSFKTIIDQVRDITKREESRNFENVLGSLADTNQSMTRILDLMKLSGEKMDSLVHSIKNQQDVFDRELTRILQVRNGGAVINIPSLSNLFIFISLFIILFLVILF